jgi:hypothetical protein
MNRQESQSKLRQAGQQRLQIKASQVPAPLAESSLKVLVHWKAPRCSNKEIARSACRIK